jgi:hypothetical protein
MGLQRRKSKRWLRPIGHAAECLFAAADQALYVANNQGKNQGKNRFAVCEPTPRSCPGSRTYRSRKMGIAALNHPAGYTTSTTPDANSSTSTTFRNEASSRRP